MLSSRKFATMAMWRNDFSLLETQVKQVLQAIIIGILLLVTLLFWLLGVASISETSSQTVDSDQEQDTRRSEVSSNVFF